MAKSELRRVYANCEIDVRDFYVSQVVMVTPNSCHFVKIHLEEGWATLMTPNNDTQASQGVCQPP